MCSPKLLCLPPVANTLRDLDMRFTWVGMGVWDTNMGKNNGNPNLVCWKLLSWTNQKEKKMCVVSWFFEDYRLRINKTVVYVCCIYCCIMIFRGLQTYGGKSCHIVERVKGYDNAKCIFYVDWIVSAQILLPSTVILIVTACNVSPVY